MLKMYVLDIGFLSEVGELLFKLCEGSQFELLDALPADSESQSELCKGGFWLGEEAEVDNGLQSGG